MKKALLAVASLILVLTAGAVAARGESLAAFNGRCIPAGCVAPPSNTPGILGRRALPAGRLARLGATPDFHHGLQAQDAKPNFSGTWNLDLAKSDFGPVPAPDSLVSVIEHKEPGVKITSTQKGQQGETVNVRNLTTDGKENTNKMRMMGGEQEMTSTSKWNGRKLTTAFKLDVQGALVEFNDAWDLSDDGKVMTIVRDIKTPQGDFTTKTVFNKQ